jgi:outer membrane protein OmpA-like peptidoglycan-associated protein
MKEMKHKNSIKHDLTEAFLFLFLFSFSLSAQNYRRPNALDAPHEFAIHAGGGYSALRYDLSQGKRLGGLGADLGVDYSYFFNKRFGIGTGAGMALYRSSSRLNGNTFVIPNLQGNMDVYDLRTTLDRYKERQRTWMITIPLLLHYQTDLYQEVSRSRGAVTDAPKFYLRGGIKVGIPVSASYAVKNASLTNVRYYPNQNVILSNRPVEGLGTFSGRSFNERLSLKPSWVATVETGIKWYVDDNLWLYTGIYFDYGLNNINKSQHNEYFLNMSETDPASFTTRSVLAAQQSGKNLTGALSTMAVGFNFRLAFGYPTKTGGGKSPFQSTWHSSGKNTKSQRKFSSEHRVNESVEKGLGAVVSQIIASTVSNIKEWITGETKQKQREMHFVAEKTPSGKQDEQHTQAQEFEKAVKIIRQPFMSSYATNTTALSPEGKKELDEKIILLKKYPQIHIIIEGHTDNTGTHEQNLKVGLRRAESAKQYLVSKGVPASQIETVSKAETEPIAPNDTKENQSKNRRVEFQIKE